MPTQNLYRFEIAEIMHQHYRHVLPSVLNRFFPSVHHLTRSKVSTKIISTKIFNNRCRQAIKHEETKIWNAITYQLRKQFYSKFKYKYKKMLILAWHLLFFLIILKWRIFVRWLLDLNTLNGLLSGYVHVLLMFLFFSVFVFFLYSENKLTWYF